MSEYSKNERHSKQDIMRLWITQAVIAILAMGISSLSYGSEKVESIQSQQITVYKSPQCGCCSKWVEHLEESGFEVEVRTVNDTASVKKSVGVPIQFSSCHTAVVGDYWIEGHVPADLIQKLLAEHPDDIKGIAVPGMPLGSPGMEAPNPTEYEVVSVDENGSVDVYAIRKGESVH